MFGISLDFYSSLLELIGMVLLIIPSIHALQYLKISSELKAIERKISDPEVKIAFERKSISLVNKAEQWKPWKAQCVYFGFGISILSYIISMISSW